MVEFLKNIEGNGFVFEKGKRYVSTVDYTNEVLKDKILIRQPNSPKKKNWWAQFSKDSEGKLFRTLSSGEMTLIEKTEENKTLEY